MFSFRVPFLIIGGRLDTELERLVLSDDGTIRVWIQAVGPISHAHRLQIRASGFSSEVEALESSERILAAVRLVFLRSGLMADFLERRVLGAISDQALQMQMDHLQADVRVINEKPGVYVYRTGEQVIAYFATATGETLIPAGALSMEMARALPTASPSPKASLSYDFYAAHVNMPSPDSAFLTLVSALEALIETEPVDAEEQAVLDDMIERASTSALSSERRQALANRLRGLKRESIRAGARRLFARLPAQQYMDISPPQFFDAAYDIRSRITHGAQSPPTEAVLRATHEMRRLVRDLLELELAGGHARLAS